jgi:hypothetical protein
MKRSMNSKPQGWALKNCYRNNTNNIFKFLMLLYALLDSLKTAGQEKCLSYLFNMECNKTYKSMEKFIRLYPKPGFTTLLFLLFTIITFQALNKSICENPEIKQLEFSNKLLYEETFEDRKAWEGLWTQFAEEHAFEIVENPVFRGKHSGKFELRSGDKQATRSGLRSEVLFPTQAHNERWYSYAIFFPSEGWNYDKDDEVVTQWHNSGTPTLSLRVRNGNLRFRIGHVANLSTSKWFFYELGSVPKDQWIEFVYHIIHSEGRDGLVEIWKNGQKVVNHRGPNKYKDSSDPSWKIGIYKSSWAKNRTLTDVRITFFDNIRMGNEHATLDDMRTFD